MTLWITLTALVAFACGLLAVPFLRRLAPAGTDNAAARFAAGQIAEVERDVARGVLSGTDATEARAEIERRLLKAHRTAAPEFGEGTHRVRLLGLAIVSGWIVLGSIGLYAVTGKPGLVGTTLPLKTAAARPAATAQSQQNLANVQDSIASLARRLDANPDDAEGWRMLGWSYFQTEDYASSVAAYQKAVALDGTDPLIFSVLGEAMVRAGGGAVDTKALAVFDKALALDPQDARARFFKGLALEQAGDAEGALALWRDILGHAPADADWAPGLRLRVTQLAEQLGAPTPEVAMPETPAAAPSSAPGPTQADVAAAAQMTDEDRSAMIRGMVERLASRLEADPSDTDGWVRLIRSYLVLGDTQAASAALDRARSTTAPEAFVRIEAEARAQGLE